MDPSAAFEQQQPKTTGAEVCMRVVARQLLQGLLLRFAQFNNVFHRQVVGFGYLSDYREIRLIETLKEAS